MRKLLAVAVSAAVLCVGLAAPVAAGKPEVRDFDFNPEFDTGGTLPGGFVFEPFDCGFDVTVGINGHQWWKYWYDKDGNEIRSHFKITGEKYFYPNDDESLRLSGRFGVNPMQTAWVPGDRPGVWSWVETINGTIWDIRVPGEGKVYRQSGQLVMDVTYDNGTITTEQKRRVGTFVFDPEALCAAMDPTE